jgi:hypothetical protein
MCYKGYSGCTYRLTGQRRRSPGSHKRGREADPTVDEAHGAIVRLDCAARAAGASSGDLGRHGGREEAAYVFWLSEPM